MNDSYKGIVRRNDTGTWQEIDDKTGTVNWEEKETARTKEYVEIFCPKRSYEIRMFDDRMELKKDGRWTWVANGRWDLAAVQPADLVSQSAVFKQDTPAMVGRYLEQVGLKTRDYVRVFGDQEFSASSDYKVIAGGTPPCNLAYYIEGDRSKIRKLCLTLNVNNQAGSRQGQSELATASEHLVKKATGQPLPQEIREAIGAAKDGEWKSGNTSLKVIKSDFKGTLNGYSLTFQIE